jgi:nucleoside-diphosphate-sugar epimerase
VTAIKPADGPIAVTGASGYIGSWIVQDCLEQGYDVRACVRDTGRPDKVDHLNAMNSAGLPGQVTLWQGDLFQPGSYDTAFDGCSAVIHAGAAVGYNRETPQQVYDGCFTENEHVTASAAKAGTVQRFVFTSSFAAVGHRRPEGYVFTENDWCDDSVEGKPSRLTDDLIPENRDAAYALAKARSERLLYERAPEMGFEAMAILPLHVIGPVMCPNHDQGWSWQNCISFMMKGKRYAKSKGGRMLWNNVDVRDVARAHRLAAESPLAKNGSRYILSATDPSGELFTWQLQARLQSLFPDAGPIGGEEMLDGKPAEHTYDSPRAYCTLAREELGLSTYPIDQTLKDTVESYYALGLLSG